MYGLNTSLPINTTIHLKNWHKMKPPLSTYLAMALTPITLGVMFKYYSPPGLAEVISRRHIIQQVVESVSVTPPSKIVVTNLTLQGEFGLAQWSNGSMTGIVALTAPSGRWQITPLSNNPLTVGGISQTTHIPQTVAHQLLVRQGLIRATQPLVTSLCKTKENLFLAVETASYRISICGQDQPTVYVGAEMKQPHKIIRLPIKTYDLYGPYFEMVNGNVTYILANSTKGKNLTVSRGTKELLREPVITGW
jgi:hypothetical protein